MRETNFHYKINRELAFISMTEKQRVKFTEAGRKTSKSIYRPKRMVVAVAVLVCMVLSVPALGATVTSYNNILSRISPELAEFLMPHDREDGADKSGVSVTDNGLTITVVSAVMDDYHMMVMLEIQDDEGRLKDGVLPIFDDSNMNASMSDIVGDYDAATDTLTVLWYEITSTPHSAGEAEIYITQFSGNDNGFDEGYIIGSWSLAFTPEYLESMRYEQRFDFEEYSIYDIVISPISLTMKTTAELYVENSGSEKPHMLPVEIEIAVSDGTVYRFTNYNAQIDYDCQLAFYYSPEKDSIDIAFATLICPDDITYVSINGIILDM